MLFKLLVNLQTLKTSSLRNELKNYLRQKVASNWESKSRNMVGNEMKEITNVQRGSPIANSSASTILSRMLINVRRS